LLYGDLVLVRTTFEGCCFGFAEDLVTVGFVLASGLMPLCDGSLAIMRFSLLDKRFGEVLRVHRV
jgi:hypothetical protein